MDLGEHSQAMRSVSRPPLLPRHTHQQAAIARGSLPRTYLVTPVVLDYRVGVSDCAATSTQTGQQVKGKRSRSLDEQPTSG